MKDKFELENIYNKILMYSRSNIVVSNNLNHFRKSSKIVKINFLNIQVINVNVVNMMVLHELTVKS